MSATVIVNLRTVVHRSSSGVSTAFPDVCKTPAAPSPVPIPYPNIAMSSNTQQGSKTVKMDGNPIMIQGSNFNPSSGDEPGTLGGVVSQTFKNKAEFIMYSFDVKVDGKNTCRQLDMMLHNKGGTFNTPPTSELQPPNFAMVQPLDEEEPAEFESLEAEPVSEEEPEE